MEGVESLVKTEAVSTDSELLKSNALRRLFSASEDASTNDSSSTPIRPMKKARAARRQAAAAAQAQAAELNKEVKPPVDSQVIPEPKIQSIVEAVQEAAPAVEHIEIASEDIEPPEALNFEPAEPRLVQRHSNETTVAVDETRQQESDASSSQSQTLSSNEETRVSRNDLVNVLESFVNLIKNTGELPTARDVAVPKGISFDPHQGAQKLIVQADDKTAEVEELRCLLVEAQETIIKLLTDRVEDRARIAQLETELRLIPDLQAQADRTIAVAMNTEDFRRDLTKVKYELERVRLAKVRSEIDRSKRSWWRGMRGWFFKTNEIIANDQPSNDV